MSFRLIDKQSIYKGKKINLELHHLENDDGVRTTQEVCVHNGAVVVLAFLDEHTIVLIRNRRHAVSQVLIELPAGTLNKGEDPMNCAGRELLEETGFLAGRLSPIGSYFASPGILSEKMYAFAAYDLQKSTSALEIGEEIEVCTTNFAQAVEMIGTGQIADAKTIATILMYNQFHRPRRAGAGSQ